MLALGIHTSGCVGSVTVLILRFHRLYDKLSVLCIHIFFRFHIGLQFIVHPARFMKLIIPVIL